MLSDAGTRRLLEAWFSLFEEHLSGDAILLILSPALFQYLCDTWEEWGEGPAAEAILKESVVLRRFPPLKRVPANVIVRHFSGKTIGQLIVSNSY
jgi:hypothetical protein